MILWWLFLALLLLWILDTIVIFLLHIKRNIGFFLRSLGVAQEAHSLHMSSHCDHKHGASKWRPALQGSSTDWLVMYLLEHIFPLALQWAIFSLQGFLLFSLYNACCHHFRPLINRQFMTYWYLAFRLWLHIFTQYIQQLLFSLYPIFRARKPHPKAGRAQSIQRQKSGKLGLLIRFIGSPSLPLFIYKMFDFYPTPMKTPYFLPRGKITDFRELLHKTGVKKYELFMII